MATHTGETQLIEDKGFLQTLTYGRPVTQRSQTRAFRCRGHVSASRLLLVVAPKSHLSEGAPSPGPLCSVPSSHRAFRPCPPPHTSWTRLRPQEPPETSEEDPHIWPTGRLTLPIFRAVALAESGGGTGLGWDRRRHHSRAGEGTQPLGKLVSAWLYTVLGGRGRVSVLRGTRPLCALHLCAVSCLQVTCFLWGVSKQ